MTDSTYSVIGSSSAIACFLIKELEKKNYKIYTFSHLENEKENEKKFEKISNEKNINIYFSIARDDLNSSLKHLNKFISISKNKKSKFFYISSINAKYPDCSYYSKIKYTCEEFAKSKGGQIIRLGLVLSPDPFGPHKSLKSLASLPFFKINFSAKAKLVTTNIESFNNIDFCNLDKQIIEIFDKEYLLNDFININRLNNSNLTINLNLLVKFLRFINKYFLLKGVFGRLLTLTCVED
jgi:hypothetical protein